MGLRSRRTRGQHGDSQRTHWWFGRVGEAMNLLMPMVVRPTVQAEQAAGREQPSLTVEVQTDDVDSLTAGQLLQGIAAALLSWCSHGVGFLLFLMEVLLTTVFMSGTLVHHTAQVRRTCSADSIPAACRAPAPPAM
jgi:hypothetical protein